MAFITTAHAFKIENPIAANDLGGIIDMVVKNIIVLVIPVAVVMIVWAGFNFLTAAGNTAKIQKGKEILKWTVIGLAIIFFGSGFIELINSIVAGK